LCLPSSVKQDQNGYRNTVWEDGPTYPTLLFPSVKGPAIFGFSLYSDFYIHPPFYRFAPCISLSLLFSPFRSTYPGRRLSLSRARLRSGFHVGFPFSFFCPNTRLNLRVFPTLFLLFLFLKRRSQTVFSGILRTDHMIFPAAFPPASVFRTASK